MFNKDGIFSNVNRVPLSPFYQPSITEILLKRPEYTGSTCIHFTHKGPVF